MQLQLREALLEIGAGGSDDGGGERLEPGAAAGAGAAGGLGHG